MEDNPTDIVKQILKKIHDNLVWAIRCKEMHNCIGYGNSPLRDEIEKAADANQLVIGFNISIRSLYSELIITVCRIHDKPLKNNTACLERLFQLLNETEIRNELHICDSDLERSIEKSYSYYKEIKGYHKLARLINARNALFAHSALDVDSRPKAKTGYAEDILEETIKIIESLKEIYIFLGIYDEYLNNYKDSQQRFIKEATFFWEKFIK